MKVQSGKPSTEGRYIVFVRCDSHQVKDWCEPLIAPWDGKQWHIAKHVYCWIGPIPLMTFEHAKDFEFCYGDKWPEKWEYDL